MVPFLCTISSRTFYGAGDAYLWMWKSSHVGTLFTHHSPLSNLQSPHNTVHSIWQISRILSLWKRNQRRTFVFYFCSQREDEEKRRRAKNFNLGIQTYLSVELGTSVLFKLVRLSWSSYNLLYIWFTDLFI